jgi:hypothetical protein
MTELISKQWADVAAQVIVLGAPVLGAALGGPLGGAAGKILADALGVPATVDDVGKEIGKAIAGDSAAQAATQTALQNAEAEWAKAIAEIARTQLSETGQTMRAEIASNEPLQRLWRPLYALELTLLECPAFAAVLGHALWSGRPELVNGFANLSGLLMTYMAARFGVLGVYVGGRTVEKLGLSSIRHGS